MAGAGVEACGLTSGSQKNTKLGRLDLYSLAWSLATAWRAAAYTLRLADIYFKEETGRRMAAKPLARNEVKAGCGEYCKVTELVAALRLKRGHYSGNGILLARA